MTQHRSTPQRQQSAPVGFARGLAATALLVAIVLGIPALLLTFGGFPLPDRVPTWAEIADLLSRPDDGSLFIGVLTWVAWVAWLVLTVLIALEAITQLRGMPPIQLPGMGWLQVAVAGLVSPAIIGLSGGTANAEESPVVAVVAYQSPGGPAHQESQQEEDTDAQEADASDPATKQRLYTVQPGDSYWRIAENQLGDPERYTEIVAANKGRAMPDGTVLSGEEFLAPGWELLLPVADQEQHEPEDSSEETVHTVKAGETLSAIASEHLGDAEAYPEIFEANQDRPQPGGARLNDPDVIDVGWTLSIPEATANTSSEAPAAPPETQTVPSPQGPAPPQPSMIRNPTTRTRRQRSRKTAARSQHPPRRRRARPSMNPLLAMMSPLPHRIWESRPRPRLRSPTRPSTST